MAETRAITLKPERKVRLRSVLGLLSVFFGLTVAGHAVFRWKAHQELGTRIQDLRAAGERVLPGDFVPRDVDPRDNAAPDLTAAATIIDDGSEEAASISWAPTTMPVNPRAWPYLARAVAWFEPALQRIEKARQRPACEWRHNFKSPVFYHMTVPELNNMSALSTLAGAAAMVEHYQGRDDRVALRFRQALYLAETCEATPAPVAHRVALGINFSALDRTECLAPHLRIGKGGAEVGEAAPADVRALIDALLDERSVDRGFRMCVDSQRMYDLNMVDTFVRAPDTELHPIARYVTEPFFDIKARRLLERASRAVTAVRGTTAWPTVASRLDSVERMDVDSNGKPFGADCVPYFRRVAREHFSVLTDRRLAATALAIRLYQLDHAGERPHRIDDLVPGYIPAVPLDAMAADGRRIGYLPSGDRPSVYSVGRNGTDDHGDESAMPGEYCEIDAWRRMDRVFYLGNQSRPYIYVPRPDAGSGMYMAGEIGQPPWERDETASPGAATTAPHLR
jgi:hypothetical protein